MEKLVFFDIDGTLIPENAKEVPQAVVKAVKELMDQNIMVFICTGRCYHQAKPIIDLIGTPNYICSNGQEVCVESQIIYEHTFSSEQTQEVMDIINRYQLNWGFETRKNLCIPDTKNAEDTLKLLQGYNFDNLESNVNPLDKKIYQFWLNGSGEPMEEVLQILTQKYTYYQWEQDLYEILPGVENKAKGITKVIEYLGQECKTYAFGDGINDLEMMKLVDESVCMGNGVIAVKDASKYVAPNSSEGGIIKGLEMVGLRK